MCKGNYFHQITKKKLPKKNNFRLPLDPKVDFLQRKIINYFE